MHRRHAVLAVVLTILGAILARPVWLYARMLLGDDRPPIIVRGGSLSFWGGDPNGQNATDCCNNWKKDLTSDEWKPDPDDKDGVREFGVTVRGVPSTVCSMHDVRGEQVLIYFQYGPDRDRDWSLYRVQIEAKGGFGKREPKIDPPRNLSAKNSLDPKRPGVLEDSREGFISGVRVGGQACGFDAWNKADLAIIIQPKSDRAARGGAGD
jgi:hypothetical protein